MRRRLPWFLCVLLWTATGFAQSDDAPQEPQADQTESSQQDTLQNLSAAIARKKSELDDAQRAVQSASGDELTEQQRNVKRLQQELAQLELNFETIATGIDIEEFLTPSREAFSLQDEIEALVRPLVRELREATEDPRQIEELRNDVAHHQQRRMMAEEALQNLRQLQTATTDTTVRENLNTLIEAWEIKQTDAENLEDVARHQLETKLRARKSLIESTSSLFGTFFRSRGLNLLMAIGAAVGVFVVMRFLAGLVAKLGARKTDGPAHFYMRLFKVLFHFSVTLLAAAAALLVLYVAGDWVLLGFFLLFLLGLAWASKHTLPMFFEQIRVLLNLGAVREQERVVFNGIPWLVEKLSVYTTLRNPALSGGLLRLPVRELIHLHSRPIAHNEIWFPCRENDWVLLADGFRGRVISQSPEMVQLEPLGGALTTYTTDAFLAANPKNISANFRLSCVFGVDYGHQAISTREIPERLHAALNKELCQMVGAENLLNLRVEFRSANSSSLDYEVIADMHGSAARDYDRLQRAIQRICVDACNREGWVIPFTQITLHQA